MNFENIITGVTCAFSSGAVIISVFNLIMTKRLSREHEYIGSVTNTRVKWSDNLQTKGASYLSIVDSIFLEKSWKNIKKKYQKMLEYQYAITITLYNYEDDIQLKSSMKQIQKLIYDCIVSKSYNEDDIQKIKLLKDDVFSILNKKYELEWQKQKYEVRGHFLK